MRTLPNSADKIERCGKGNTSGIRGRQNRIIFQQDDARPHIANVVKTYLERLDWEILPHLLYFPDIAPFDYYLFRLISHVLAEKRFQSFEDIKKWVYSWIASKNEDFFRNGIRKLPEKWRNVIAGGDQYFQ